MSPDYLKMFLTTANIAAGNARLTEDRALKLLHGNIPTEMEKLWLARGLSESSLDILTSLTWHLDIPVANISKLLKECQVTRNDWDYD